MLKYLVLWCTNRCNLNCTYCYAKNNLGNEDMNINIAKKGIDILDDNGTLILAGGEPLLNISLIKEIYSYIRDNNRKIKINMQTNATLIDRNMAKELKKLNVGIGVSIDGKPNINDICRGHSSDVIRGIQYLGEENIKINLNAVITRNNINELSGLVDLAYYLENVNGIGLDLLRSNDLNLRASAKEVHEGINKAYERSKQLQVLTGKKVFIREIEDARQRINKSYEACHYCYASKGEAAVIIPNGDMYLCSSLVGIREYFLGNIEKSFKLRALEDIEFDECKKCKYYKMCRKICPSRGILNNVDGVISREECALRKACFSIAENS